MRNSVFTLTLLGMLATGCHASLAAEEAIPPAVQQRIDELDLKVRTLERRLEVDQETKLAEKAKQTATVSAGADGFALKSNDGAFQLKLRGLLHADGRYFFEDEDRTNGDTYLLRRARPILEGTVFKIFDFRFMPDFGNGRTVIQDVYADARLLPWLQLKGGKLPLASSGCSRPPPSASSSAHSPTTWFLIATSASSCTVSSVKGSSAIRWRG